MLEQFAQPLHEAGRHRAVDDTVVEGAGEIHHQPADHGATSHHRP